MSSNSIFTSLNSEKRWILEITNYFPKEHVVEITPCCVFKVPRSLNETKPEAYAPQKIGLGPYHHLRPDLYTMQNQKLAAIIQFMGQDNLNNIHKVAEALIEWEPALRACYDQFLDLDVKTLAWIVAIDGLYLLQFLRNLRKKEIEKSAVDVIMFDDSNNCDSEIENDIIKLENQIPIVLLKKILQVLENDIHTLSEDFDVFCRGHSPLELTKNSAILQDNNQEHLLHRMYHLIVNNQIENEDSPPMDDIQENCPIQVLDFGIIKEVSSPPMRMGNSSPSNPVQVPATSRPTAHAPGSSTSAGRTHANRIHAIVDNFPWDKIKALIKKHDPDHQNIPVEEIKIPSISQMFQFAGITFSALPPTGGIRGIGFRELEGRKIFYLPVIIMDIRTEIILRNLVAFELSKPGLIRGFTLYVDLMCGIIDTEKDVKILKDALIIKGELSDDEIVRIFNGMRRATKENDKAMANIKQAIDDANQKYDDAGNVKVKRFVKKYFSAPWKCMSVVVSVVVVVLLALQAFCLLFGCARWFGENAVVDGGHFLYAHE